MSGFSGLVDIQPTLGSVLLLWGGFSGMGFSLYPIGHGLIMIAAVVAHLSRRWKNPEAALRFRSNLFLVFTSLVLVVIGISLLPGGLSR